MAKKKTSLHEQAMKERNLNIAAAKKALEEKKIMVVDKDAIINLPFSGSFRSYIEDTLNYIFSTATEEDLITALHHIKNNFKDYPEDAPPNPLMNACWTLMVIQTEFNKQAVEQGHVIITDDDYDSTLNNMFGAIQETTDEDLKAMFKANKADYDAMRKLDEEWKAKKTDQNKESAYDSPQSNED